MLNFERNAGMADVEMTEAPTECPFYRDGMTYGEYDEEFKYFSEHYKDFIAGTYKPLWKQKEKQ